MQIKHILLPVDGSSYSGNATNYAIHLAKLCGSRVTAVSCYEWLGHMVEVPESMTDKLKGNFARQAEEILEQTARKLSAEGIENETDLKEGAPGKMLTNLAKSKKFDLIIMGSHGHSDISGLFLGSVTHKVLNTIYCPVLVVP
ncbi:MAG: universal stress protein [Desulfobulbaceae bacterium]|nr:MAG: universal stress protein [Desulfobulbaceae bacterium]